MRYRYQRIAPKPMHRLAPALFAFLLLAGSACNKDGRPTPATDSATNTGTAGAPVAAPENTQIDGPKPALDTATTLGSGPAWYEIRPLDPVLEAIRDRDKAWQKAQEDETGAIHKRQKEKKKRERKTHKRLTSGLPALERPASIDVFHVLPHQPPTAQFYTGTCWAFSGTSLMESEAERITGHPVKLSEMATVYYEYLDKASRFISERGGSRFGEGSELNALTRVWGESGAMPRSVYPGILAADGRYDHLRLVREMDATLAALKSNGMWDKASALAMLRVLLDRNMGRPPEHFTVDGSTWTPKRYMREVLHIDPSAYVDVMSTLSAPYWKRGELKVPDNWWHDKGYYNVPLDDFYAAFKGALERGFTIAIAIDTSEPGHNAAQDIMFIPSYDIPSDDIDAYAREYRVTTGATTDDHGIHVVGFTRHAGHDWFLAKDSGRSARHGHFDGYYFIRDDYIRLKVLAYSVHRDGVRDLLTKFPADAKTPPTP